MNSKSVTAFIGLGSNIGDRKKHLDDALEMLKKTEGISLLKVSPVYETKPVGYTQQPYFLNCVAEIQTVLPPYELLDICLDIENRLKRIRKIRWGPRTADLDILFYGNLVTDDEKLTIPHPRLHERGFVLIPMLDIAPDMYHPVFKTTIRELYGKFLKEDRKPEDVELFEGDKT